VVEEVAGVVVTALAIAFGLAAAGTATMAAINWRRRGQSPAYRVIAFVGAGVSLVNGLSLIHVMVPRPAVVSVIVSAQIVVAPIIVAGVACMSLLHSDRAWRLSRRAAVLLAVVPAVMLIVAVTNPWHHRLVTAVGPVDPQGLLMPVPGPAFWTCLAYMQLLLVGSALRVFVLRRRASSATQRRLCTHALITYLPPMAVGMLAGALPFPVIDVIPLGQALSMVYVQIAWLDRLSRHMPVAHRQLFATISDAVTVVDPMGRIIEVNPAAHALLHRLVPGSPDDLTRMVVPAFASLEMDEHAATEQTLPDVWGSGIDLHVQINPVRDRRNAFLGWVLVGRDLTESTRRRRKAEADAVRLREQLETIQVLQANLAEQARRDVLTGLHNRRYLMERLETDMLRAAAVTGLSLALIDLDHFKEINDRYGHACGDAVLAHTGQLFASAVRHDDMVARYGGEEFVIVFYGVRPETAWLRIDALREQLARTPIDLGGQTALVTMSAGVSGFTAGSSIEDLLWQADQAMYEAKRKGRNRVELHGHLGPLPAASDSTAALASADGGQ
jgi:diguanylate cyclase (GGDEF)-like protein